MKKKDLKVGEFYAVKDNWRTQLAMLLDLDSLYKYDWGRSSATFKKSIAPKPYKGFRERTGYAIVVLNADTPKLRKAAKAVTVDQVLAASSIHISDGLTIDTVVSLPAFLGPYEDVMKQQADAREQEDAARRKRQSADDTAQLRYEGQSTRLKGLGLRPLAARTWESRIDSVQLRFDDVDKLLAMAEFVDKVRKVATTYDGTRPVVVEIAGLLDELDEKLKPSE